MNEVVFVRRGGLAAFTSPVSVAEARTLPEIPPCLERVRRGLRRGLYAAGFVAYEAAAAFDRAFCAHPPAALPLVWFGLYRPPASAYAWPAGDFQVGAWRPLAGRAEYGRKIRAIRRLIAAGDVYQVNYTFPLQAKFSGNAAAWFRRLCAAQPADHCAYICLPRRRILSISPELLFRLEKGELLTRPMKGTRPRAADAGADRRAARALAASAKDRAENVMIVDLLRNDMSRVCRPGSVRVRRLCALEKYPTVWQMTSTITGRTGAAPLEVLQALFPSGSVTGAPKVRALQIIRELETFPRGIYCGSIGWMAPDGRAEFNVAIRTAEVDLARGRARYHVGGGITFDSTVAGEYQECLDKAAVLRQTAGMADA